MMSETMSDREWSYVAMSRHRKRLRVFVAEGEGEELKRAIGRSRQKGLASDLVQKPEIERLALEQG
jgi:ATP-dependent exoDNAse (exonuclease V) alpha subunit